jgi:multidrug efflux pump subunit AcrA (membrane-fusion protein)
VSVSLPVDGTDGLVRLRVRAKGPGSGQLLSIACVDLREDES